MQRLNTELLNCEAHDVLESDAARRKVGSSDICPDRVVAQGQPSKR